MGPSEERVRVEVEGHRATITLDSPAKRNALSEPLVEQLQAALATAIEDPDVRVIVVTAVGSVFCAGADLKPEPLAVGAGDFRAARAGALFNAMLRCPKPLVARVNGHARAAGVGLIGACDIAIAVDTATFAINEIRVGVLPATVSVPLTTRMSPGSLRRYSLTGEVFGSADAVGSGLLDDCGELSFVDETVDHITQQFAFCEPGALQQIKPYLDTLVAMPRDQATEFAVSISRRAFESAAAAEGRRAFREHRAPAWAL